MNSKTEKQLKDLTTGTMFEIRGKAFYVLKQLDDITTITAAESIGDMRFDEETNNWESSNLRNELNTTILKEYEEMFGADNIILSETDLTAVDGLKDFGTCTDKIRLMTFEEYREYQLLFNRKEEWEWTCTPWSTPARDIKHSVCVVSPYGGVDDGVCDSHYAVRPFCILKSNIFVSMEGNENE